MFELIAGVQIGVVRAAGLLDLPKDLQPALSQTTEGAGMALASCAMGFVVGLGPRAFPPA